MNTDVLRKWWGVVLQKDVGILEDYRGPLINMKDYVAYFNLSPLPTLKFNIDIVPDLKSKKPSFKNLSEVILLNLRKNIYTKTDIDIVELWAETLMRFCEIRYSTLKKRSIEKWRDKSAARLHLLHLSAFLLDYGFYSNDLRFLNTVLKLSDQKWIISKNSIKRNLKRGEQEIICAFFQIRIHIMTEYTIKQLNEGKWYE